MKCSCFYNWSLNFCGLIEEVGLSFCAEPLGDYPSINFNNEPEEVCQNFINLRNQLIYKNLNQSCKKCKSITKNIPLSSPSDYLHFVNISSYPSACNAKCIYCTASLNLKKGEKIYIYNKMIDILKWFIKNNYITSKTIWIIASGEITVHPYKKEILELLKIGKSRILTNGFVFDQDIGEILKQDVENKINISIDSGTRNTFIKVKGSDNFSIVISNLIKYNNFNKNKTAITLKYILLPGINDNMEDYYGVVDIMKLLNIKYIELSRNLENKYQGNNILLIKASIDFIKILQENNLSYSLNTLFTPTEILVIEEIIREKDK